MYTAKWKDIERFVYLHINTNLWKLDNLYEEEDFYQEAYLIFLTVQKKYGSTVKNKAHFLSLFRTFLDRWTIDKGNEVLLSKNLIIPTEGDFLETYDVIDSLENEGEFYSDIKNISDELRQVFDLLLNSPKELLEEALKEWKLMGRKKPLSDKFFNHFLGGDSKRYKYLKEIKSFLKD